MREASYGAACPGTFLPVLMFEGKIGQGFRSFTTQPLTTQIILERRLALAGVPTDRIEDLEQCIVLRTGIGLAPRDPREWAKNVRIPTFLY